MLNTPTMMLARALALWLLFMAPLYAQSDNSRRAPPAGRHACEKDRAPGRLSSNCVKHLLRDENIRAVLEQTPAFQDGRLNFRKLEILAERLAIGETASVPEDYNADEEVANEHMETGADGRPVLKFLDDETLHRLREATPPEVDDIALDRTLGPSTLLNIPATPPPDTFPIPGPGFELPPPNPNHLDVLPFLQDLHAALSPNVNGYAARIQHQGQTIGVLQWNWSRKPGDDPAQGWNSNRRMHIASISKFMTAIGLVHLLENTPGLYIDDTMAQFLPAYWNRFAGANELITFENLMNHRSGFSTGGSSSNWQTMKSNVEAGVALSDVGNTFDYENMNFGLIRILIATVGGYVNPNTNFGSVPFFPPDLLNDLMWDIVTRVAYEDYMRTYVFNPVGVNPQLDKNLNTTLAYRFDASGSGWNSGNFAPSAGGFGWHMTVSEILQVVRAVRTNQIVSVFGKFDLLNQSLGLNSPLNGEPSAAGPIYYKAGLWTDNDENPAVAHTEQCFLLMLPNDMELVVFVNSPIGISGETGVSLTNLVRTLFSNHIVGS